MPDDCCAGAARKGDRSEWDDEDDDVRDDQRTCLVRDMSEWDDEDGDTRHDQRTCLVSCTKPRRSIVAASSASLTSRPLGPVIALTWPLSARHVHFSSCWLVSGHDVTSLVDDVIVAILSPVHTLPTEMQTQFSICQLIEF